MRRLPRFARGEMLSAEKMNKIVEAIERAININFSGAVGDIDSPAGRVVVFPNQPASPQLLVADFPQLTATVVGAISGAAGSGSIEVFGNLASTFSAGLAFRLLGSKANNSYYRVAPAGSSATLEASGYITTIPVNEAVADGSATGSVFWEFSPQAVTVATAGDDGTGSFGVAGDVGGIFQQGYKFGIGHSANNMGIYSLATDPDYDSTTNVTTFTVNETVPSSTADGYLWPYYPSPQDIPVSYPASTPAALTFDAAGTTTGPLATFDWSTPISSITASNQYIPRGSLVLCEQVNSQTVPMRVIAQADGFLFGASGASDDLWRLDPQTGAVIWHIHRGGSLPTVAMCSDSNGCLYTCGGETSSANVEKWDQDGNLVWKVLTAAATPTGGSGSPRNTAIAVDKLGNVYVGYQTAENSYVQQYTATGATGINIQLPEPFEYADFGINEVNETPPINGIAIDPIDSRIAIAFGQTGTQTYPVYLSSTFVTLGAYSQYQVVVFSSTGMQITMTAMNPSGQQIYQQYTAFATAGPQAAVTFDKYGSLYSVGTNTKASSGMTQTNCIGWIFDYTGTKTAEMIAWSNNNTPFPLGSCCVADSFNRALIWTSPDISLYSLSVVESFPFVNTEGQYLAEWVWKRQLGNGLLASPSVAVDRSGTIYVALSEGGESVLYALDQLGNVRWASMGGNNDVNTPGNIFYCSLLAAS